MNAARAHQIGFAVIVMVMRAAQPASAHPGGGGNLHSFDLTGTIPPAILSQPSFRVDEVRVELTVGVRLESDGAGQYYASARLLEGTSCSTTDWDGSASIGITWLFVNACHSRQFTVRNDRDGGDFATITFRIEQDHQPFIQRC